MAIKRNADKTIARTGIKGGTVLRHAPEYKEVRVFVIEDPRADLYVEVELINGVTYSLYYASRDLFERYWLKSVERRRLNKYLLMCPVKWDVVHVRVF